MKFSFLLLLLPLLITINPFNIATIINTPRLSHKHNHEKKLNEKYTNEIFQWNKRLINVQIVF